jgi:two-component system response regulator HupR/HoxA
MQDLYYRLAGVVLRLPPLRQRPAELLPLAEEFLRAP